MTWRQYNIEFADHATARAIAAAELGPELETADAAGELHSWWFMNKSPWKLRLVPTEAGERTVRDLLDLLVVDGRIISWATGVYEPETLAFGGEHGIQVAHMLFHHDS